MLKPRKRLVKTKLKEDKFVTRTAQVQAFLTTYRRQIIYGFVAVLVAAVVGFAVGLSKAKADKDAAFAALQVRDAYGRGDLDGSLTQANAIIEDYPSSRYAAVALMTKGRIFEQRGQLSEAIETYKKLISKHGNQIYLAFGACYSLGSIYHGMGNFNDAAEWYVEAAKRYPKHFNAAYAMLEAGRSYRKANKYDQAKTILRKVLTDYDKSRAVDQARQELEEIEFLP